jgi:hypothetical protein
MTDRDPHGEEQQWVVCTSGKEAAEAGRLVVRDKHIVKALIEAGILSIPGVTCTLYGPSTSPLSGRATR